MSSNPSPNRLLTHPEVTKIICCTLAKWMREQDVEDARQEVYVRVLRFFRTKPQSAPTELANMKAFCARVARNYAIARGLEAKRQRALLAQKCPREEYGAVARESLPRRDPVDVERQLAVLADLFREGLMPEHGIDILEGVASRCSYEEIGTELGSQEAPSKRGCARCEKPSVSAWPGWACSRRCNCCRSSSATRPQSPCSGRLPEAGRRNRTGSRKNPDGDFRVARL